MVAHVPRRVNDREAELRYIACTIHGNDRKEGAMKRALVLITAIALLGAACLATPAMAAEPYKLTFSGTVHVPGATLGAGTYLFTPIALRVIQVTSTDHKTLYTTFMTLPRYRAEITRNNVIVFGEVPLDVSPPINIWFPAYEHFGREFVYQVEHERMIGVATR
jgi:hypothetical protein